MLDVEDVEVLVGIDVGKSDHWATALTRDGEKVLDGALPNDEARLRAGLLGVFRTLLVFGVSGSLGQLLVLSFDLVGVRYPSAE